jgi:valyl-tRNA synthetase
VEAERHYLTKDPAAAEKELRQTWAKLGSEAFFAEAPRRVGDENSGRLATA